MVKPEEEHRSILEGHSWRVSPEESKGMGDAVSDMGYREGPAGVLFRDDEHGRWMPLVFDDTDVDTALAVVNRAQTRERNGCRLSKRTQNTEPNDDGRAPHHYGAGRGDRGGGPRQ